MEKDPMTFVEGMSFYAVPPTAPETVRGKISFKANQMMDFLNAHKDEKGWVNVKMMKSKQKGSIYFILDTFKPKSTMPKEESDEYHNRYQNTEPAVLNNESHASGRTDPSAEYPNGINLDDIPF